MKDYYQMDLDEFRKNNPELFYEIRKEAGKHSADIGLTVPEFIEQKLKEAHSSYVLSQGVQDPFEYYVDKHEPDTSLALQIIEDRRKQTSDFLGIVSR